VIFLLWFEARSEADDEQPRPKRPRRTNKQISEDQKRILAAHSTQFIISVNPHSREEFHKYWVEYKKRRLQEDGTLPFPVTKRVNVQYRDSNQSKNFFSVHSL